MYEIWLGERPCMTLHEENTEEELEEESSKSDVENWKMSDLFIKLRSIPNLTLDNPSKKALLS